MKVLPIHCHQRLEENTLVKDFSISGNGYEILLDFKDKNLSFFYDHDIDHIAGMVEVSALRQCGLVIAHLGCNIPMDWIVTIRNINVDMVDYADKDKESKVFSTADLIVKRNKYKEIFLRGGLLQDDKYKVRMTGTIICMEPKFAKRIRG